MIIDPENGNILGVAGGIGEKSANRVQNYAVDTVRPSGSSVKPLSVYAPALEEGLITWSSVYDDVPVKFIGNGNGGYTEWPQNASLTYRGLTNIRCAVQNSINTVSVRVLETLGADLSYNYLKSRIQVESLIDADKGIAALASVAE